MKTSGQVVHHLRQRVFRAQKKYLSFHLKRSSYNCKHNILTKREYEYKGEISSCTHPEYIESKPFNVEVGQLTRVVEMPYYPACGESNPRYLDCPHFTPRKSKEELQVEFRKTLLEKSKNPAEIAESNPDIAQLLWVLGVESLESLDSLSEPEPLTLTAEDEEGRLAIEQATMEAAMDSSPGLDDPEHPEYEDPEPAKEQPDEGDEVLKKALACFDNLPSKQKPLPEPPTLSLGSSKPHTIRQTPNFIFPTWISWLWSWSWR